jgi:tripartite-type tricarboxylate transporter receptor subunit TctC
MRDNIGRRNEAARMAMFKSRAFGFSAMLMAALALVPQARADDFYKGKLFTIVVGFSPAGGYDNYARVLSRYIGSHIPGNPTVIVQNMPGAGSLTSVRYLNRTRSISIFANTPGSASSRRITAFATAMATRGRKPGTR